MDRDRNIALVAIIAAIYALLVYTLPVISFLIFQVRVADALIPLSMILGTPAIIGVSIGCFIANIMAPWGSPFLIAIDMLLGSIANAIASWAAMKTNSIKGKVSPLIRFQLGCSVANLVITIIVGSYIPILMNTAFNVPMPLWMGWVGVFLGEVIAINLVGYLLVFALWKRGISRA